MNISNSKVSVDTSSAEHVTSNGSQGSGHTEQQKGRSMSNGAHDLPQSKNVGVLGNARPSNSGSYANTGMNRSMKTVNDADGFWGRPQRNQQVDSWTTGRNRSQSHSAMENQRHGAMGSRTAVHYSNQGAQTNQVHIGPETTIAWLPVDDSVFEYQETLFDR